MSAGKEKSGQITIAVIGCLGGIVAAIITGIFTLLNTSMLRSPAPEPPRVIVATPETTQPEAPQDNTDHGTTDGLAVAVSASDVGIDPSTITRPSALPANFTCPFNPNAGWLTSPLIWYGPFLDRSGISHAIGYDNFQIHAWSSLYGIQSWDDPQVIGGRNQWLTLNGTPFSVCVDTIGNVFAAFSP